jgi:CBS-domain-containing membrane protein
MTRPPLVTVPVGTTLEQAKAKLHEHRIEKLLVIDGEGNLKGLITVKDIQTAASCDRRPGTEPFVGGWRRSRRSSAPPCRSGRPPWRPAVRSHTGAIANTTLPKSPPSVSRR